MTNIYKLTNFLNSIDMVIDNGIIINGSAKRISDWNSKFKENEKYLVQSLGEDIHMPEVEDGILVFNGENLYKFKEESVETIEIPEEIKYSLKFEIGEPEEVRISIDPYNILDVHIASDDFIKKYSDKLSDYFSKEKTYLGKDENVDIESIKKILKSNKNDYRDCFSDNF